MNERSCCVQFIHPGGEHRPDAGSDKGWNKGNHQRKFLKTPGHYLADGVVREGNVVFWGEWEPQSRVVKSYQQPVLRSPQFLYEPHYELPANEPGLQNTDPFVFGQQFHYTGCMQHTRRGPTQLRYLARGSVILFGSCHDRARFVVDTVFVVSHYVDHQAGNWRSRLDGRISETYREVTIEPWYRGAQPDNQSHRLYFGATPEQLVEGMFSFFPCQTHDKNGHGFARPTVDLPGYVTRSLTQGKKITVDLSLATLGEIWREVVRQIKAQGLLLGVRAELPSVLQRHPEVQAESS